MDIMKARWGNSYVRAVYFKDKEGELIELNSDYKCVFTVKSNLEPDNDDKAEIKVETIHDADQVANKGKSVLIISKDMNKIKPEMYSADFKVFYLGEPKNTTHIQYNLQQSVGKDE